MNNLVYLFAAYALIWALVFLYVYSIANRQRSLEREIAALRDALEDKERGQ
jgi:CcmD family protein